VGRERDGKAEQACAISAHVLVRADLVRRDVPSTKPRASTACGDRPAPVIAGHRVDDHALVDRSRRRAAPGASSTGGRIATGVPIRRPSGGDELGQPVRPAAERPGADA
jgi:hypothetical protein